MGSGNGGPDAYFTQAQRDALKAEWARKQCADQVAAWNVEIKRLQDLVAHATGAPDHIGGVNKMAGQGNAAQIPLSALHEFSNNFCGGKSELAATAESAFYWFNKWLVEQGDAAVQPTWQMISADDSYKRLTEMKALSIVGRGYRVTGYVLRDESDVVCISEKSAVRWIDQKEWFSFMQCAEHQRLVAPASLPEMPACTKSQTGSVQVEAQQEDARDAEIASLRSAIDCACNALTDSICCSGNDSRTNLLYVRKLKDSLRAAIASTKEPQT